MNLSAIVLLSPRKQTRLLNSRAQHQWNVPKRSFWIWMPLLAFLSSCFLPSCFAANESERSDHVELRSRHLANKRLRTRFSKSSKRRFKKNKPANSTKSSKNILPSLSALLPLHPASTSSTKPSAYPSKSPSMYPTNISSDHPSTSPSMRPTDKLACGGPGDEGLYCFTDNLIDYKLACGDSCDGSESVYCWSSTSDGTTVDGTFCAEEGDCSNPSCPGGNGDCPTGYKCVINSCCGVNVGKPLVCAKECS